MRRTVLYLIFPTLIIFFTSQAKSQAYGQNVQTELAKLFGRLEKVSDDNSRILINDSIRLIIDSYAASDSVLKHRFNNLRYLGQIVSSDKKLKIITWNLILSNNKNRYFCYFITKGKRGKDNSVYRLTAGSTGNTVRTDTVYFQDNWYGALYYDLRPVRIKNEICYVLLGIDFGDPIVTRKIIDVLSFNQDGKIIFGKKWFNTGNEIKYRVVFEYDATGVMSLKFRSARSIVFDHLVPISRGMKEEQQSYGAEYSFDRYFYKNGIWKFERNVDVRNKE